MSGKKDLKQSRLPFQILTSPKAVATPPSALATSPRTPHTTPVVSRKRKPSSDGENLRSTKIGRTNSKENIIAERDPVEILKIDDDDDDTIEQPQTTTTTTATAKKDDASEKKNSSKSETTPGAASDSSVRIKLPSRRKQTFDLKPQKSQEEIIINDDDSVVYLDEEDLPKKPKKSTKKAKSQQKPIPAVSADRETRAKKALKMNESVEEEVNERQSEGAEMMEIDDIEKEEQPLTVCETKIIPIKIQLEKCLNETNADAPAVSEEISKLVEKPPLNEDIHDQIIDLLSDDAKSPPRKERKSLSGDAMSAEKTTPKLTPKALAKRKELEAKRIEKEHQRLKEREEKEKQRLQEKQMREDAKKKEKEEKEEQRKREKEEREKKKQAEIEKKEEERRQKEEEKKRLVELKEEEKKAKEEERRQKEEERKRQNDARDEEKKKREIEKLREEERKKKTAEAFSKFFVPKRKADIPAIHDDISKDSAESVESSGNFMPFQIRGKMRLAPCVRLHVPKSQLDALDELLKNNDENESYLRDLKNGKVPKKTGKTWPEEDKDDEVVIVDELEGIGEDIITQEENLKFKYRAKLLMFTENRRPAFYGTWRKKSSSITGRRPFAFDSKFFDYEVDSDEEWEEEEPGESLHGSDSEKEKETYDDNYELDDDFFVPHGHLSEEEMQEMDDAMNDNNTPEVQKAKLKIMQQEFAAEMKKPTEKIKPRLIGCIWMNGDEDENGCSKMDKSEKKYHCSDIIWRILKAREMMCGEDEIKLEDLEPEIAEPEEESGEKIVKTPAQKKAPPKIDNDSVREFIRLIHGNVNSKKFLIREFQAYRLKTYHKDPDFQEFSVKSVDEKMTEISAYKTCPEEGPLFGKKCWYVKSEVIREHMGDEKLTLPNQWTYILEKKSKQSSNNNAVNNGGEASKKSSREVSPSEEGGGEKVNETPAAKACDSRKPQKAATKLKAIVKDSPKLPSSNESPESTCSQKPKTPASSKAVASTPKESPKTSSPATQNATKSAAQNNGKKRVPLLMSVQRGQSINEEKKKSLISNFLKSSHKPQTQGPVETTEVKIGKDDVIEIID